MKRHRNQTKLHKPVLVREVLEALQVKKFAHLKKQSRYIDATLGLGGHSSEIIRKGAQVLGIEADKSSIEAAVGNLSEASPSLDDNHRVRYKIIYGNFRNIDKIGLENGFSNVDGIIYDLGISSYQLASPGRGFSFKSEADPLDMRLDHNLQMVTGADLLNSLSKKQLVQLFYGILDLRYSRKLSSNIVNERNRNPINTVAAFNKLIKESVKKSRSLDVSTLPYLALRIAVNSELDNLKESLPKAFNLLKIGGRIVVISFHSGEDSIVKNYFKEMELSGKAIFLNKKPIQPQPEEMENNPRSRSAKLRILEKIKN